ncbi:MAG: hypothetical protein ABH821_03705 [archaeon]
MFDIAVRLLLHRNMKLEKGKILLFNQPCALIPTPLIVDLLKSFGVKKEKEIYYAAKKEGYRWFKDMNKQFGRLNKDQVISWGPRLITLAGMGEVVPIVVDHKKKVLVFELKESPMDIAWGNCNRATGHIFRGLAAGAICFAYKTNMDAVEVLCKAKGDKTCQIIVKKAEKFDRKDSKIKQQLGGKIRDV